MACDRLECLGASKSLIDKTRYFEDCSSRVECEEFEYMCHPVGSDIGLRK